MTTINIHNRKYTGSFKYYNTTKKVVTLSGQNFHIMLHQILLVAACGLIGEKGILYEL